MSFTRFSIFLLLSAVAVSHAAEPEAYALKLWTVEDHLPGSPVVGVAQANEGYLWLATRTQLIRFNGSAFVEIPIPDTLRQQVEPINGVFCGQGKGIWIYGAKGLARYVAGVWQGWSTTQTADVIGRLLGMVETPDGVIRAYAERGLLEAVAGADDETTQFVPRRCPVPPDDRATLGAMTSAAADRNGSIWITAWNGLLEYTAGRFDDQSMRLPDFLVEAADGVHAGRSGRLWIHGSNGIAVRENQIWKPIGFPENAGMTTVMLETSDGALWMGNPAGVFRWSAGAWTRITEQDTPGSLSVNQLFEDRDGTVWVACDGGLLRIRRKRVGTLSAEGSATAGTAYTLHRMADGSAWIGYKGRAVRVTASGRLLQTVYLDADVPVSALLQDSLGRVWLGTLGGGLYVWQNGHLTLTAPSDYNLPAIHTIHALIELPTLGLLVGTQQGLMRLNAQMELTFASFAGTRIEEPVRALYHDPTKILWICGERSGILAFSESGQRLFTGHPIDRSAPHPRTILRDSSGHLWVGTTAGLATFREGVLYTVGQQAGLFNDAVLNIAEDNRKRLWLGTTRGLQCVMIEDLDPLRQPARTEGADPSTRLLHLGVEDGLPGERCMGITRTTGGVTNGTLWFPFEKGVARVDPEEVAFADRPPEVVIERVTAGTATLFDRETDRSGETLVSPGVRNIVFHFAALAPGMPESVRFRYRIETLGKGWSAIQAERSAAFEWLPPGRHTLHVIAEAGGVWNLRGTSFSFTVKARFVQTVWFFLLLALASGLLIFLIARWMWWHRYQLQMAMLKREEALAHERARISRDIHDDLGNGLSVVATLSELAHNDVEKGTAHKRLDQIYDVANELARNVDEIVWAVNPANDGWEPFLSYFEQYTEYFLGHSGLRFHFDRPTHLVGHAIASKTRHHLLLAVREAIGNVLKHAHAKQVRIAMELDGPVIEVRVEDDGIGFDTAHAAKVGHDGLGNMARRMREAGGTFSIESRIGNGTQVTFRVPVDSSQHP